MSPRCLAGAALAPAFVSFAAAEEPAEMPDIAAAMLEAAAESGEAAEIAAVAKALKAVFPDYADAVDASTQTRIAALAPEGETEDSAFIIPHFG